VASLASKIASPVSPTWPCGRRVELYDLQPHGLPDLFAGDELVVFGRYRGAGNPKGVLTVPGALRDGDGTKQRSGGALLDGCAVRERATGADYVQQLWAARKAGALSSDIRLHGPNRRSWAS